MGDIIGGTDEPPPGWIEHGEDDAEGVDGWTMREDVVRATRIAQREYGAQRLAFTPSTFCRFLRCAVAGVGDNMARRVLARARTARHVPMKNCCLRDLPDELLRRMYVVVVAVVWTNSKRRHRASACRSSTRSCTSVACARCTSRSRRF